MASYKTTKNLRFGAVAAQRMPVSANFRTFVSTFGEQKAAVVFGIDRHKVRVYFREGAPVWVHEAAGEYLKRYAPMLGTGPAPELDEDDVERPDRFLRAMIHEFPDTAIGAALKKALADTKTRLTQGGSTINQEDTTMQLALSGQTTNRVDEDEEEKARPVKKPWIDYKTANATRREKIAEARAFEARTGEKHPYLEQLREAVKKAQKSRSEKLAEARAFEEQTGKPHPYLEQLRASAEHMRAARVAKLAAGDRAAAPRGPKSEEHRAKMLANLEKAHAAKAAKSAAKAVEKDPPRPVERVASKPAVTPRNEYRAVSLLEAAIALVEAGGSAQAVVPLLRIVQEDLSHG